MSKWNCDGETNRHANKIPKKLKQENTYRNLLFMSSSFNEDPMLTVLNVTCVLDGFTKPEKFV
jgi:hypothetical protein